MNDKKMRSIGQYYSPQLQLGGEPSAELTKIRRIDTYPYRGICLIRSRMFYVPSDIHNLNFRHTDSHISPK